MAAAPATQTPEIDWPARVRVEEDAWNLRELDTVVLGNRLDCQWRHGNEFLWGREQVRTFLACTWKRQEELRVVRETWVAKGSRITLRFATEFRAVGGAWFRGVGSECWECDRTGLVGRRLVCADTYMISKRDRALLWPGAVRPADFPTLDELGL